MLINGMEYELEWNTVACITVDREYFVVTKIVWAKCLMSFNLVGTRNFNYRNFYYTELFNVTFTCVVIDMAAYGMEPCRLDQIIHVAVRFLAV